jgi:hypothetical protein
MTHRRLQISASALLAAVACTGLITACTPASVNSTPAASGQAAGGSTPASKANAAKIGSTLDLTGNSSGEKMAVTVVKVTNRAHGASFFTPDHGKRFFAVQFRLHNVGSATYNDSPSNGAQVVDSSGQSYQSDLSDVHHCQSFPGSEIIAAGETGLGCIIFQVAKSAHITQIQFTLDSGFASDTGEWDVQG